MNANLALRRRDRTPVGIGGRSTPAATRPVSAWTPAARQLGRVEGRRMLRHPAYPIAAVYLAAFVIAALVNQQSGRTGNFVYMVVFFALVLVYAPATLLVTNRVTTTTHRRPVRDIFDGTPVGDRQRTIAAIVGLVCGPLLVGVVGAGVLLALGPFATATDPDDAVYPRTALEYLQVPALVLGAGLLGITIARWLPQPGLLPVAALIVWLGTIAMYPLGDTDRLHGRIWFALWPVWFSGHHGMLPRQPFHQEVWHLIYLLGLGLLAGVTALLRTAGPRRTLWATAAIGASLTALAAWLQLG